MKKMDYVDLFAVRIPKRNVAKYKRSAKVYARVIKRLGALDYREFIGDDLHAKGMTPFTKDVKLKSGEALVCAYVLYHSRADRDRANRKMMVDPEMKKEIDRMNTHPLFDMKRMLYGGFKTIVRL